MKKWLIVCLLLSCCVSLYAQKNGSWDVLHGNAKEHLTNLINIDTSLPEPDETKAARYIYKQFNKHHLDWDIFIPSKGRANLMARIKGTDPTQKPLLLISHLDTIPADLNEWQFPPFNATEENGNIYGLGATDAKNYTAIYLALFNWLSTLDKKPLRDIIFLATSGEESGSETGLLWLAQHYWDKINAGYALNEGGGIIKSDNGTNLVFAEAATKLYMNIKVTAQGSEEHSSMQPAENAVYRLSQALARIENYPIPAQLTPTAKSFFKSIIPLQDEDGKTTIQMLLVSNPQNSQNAAEIMAQDPFFRTQLKDTITPTILSGARDTGATAATASAVLNVRLLPGSDPDAFFNRLNALFENDDNIILEVLERPQGPAPQAMDGSDPLFASIQKTASKLMPRAISVTGLSPASGDSEYLRKLGVITYGLGPDMDPLQQNSAHAADEFINEQSFYNQFDFVAGIVFDFAYQEYLLPLKPNKI